MLSVYVAYVQALLGRLKSEDEGVTAVEYAVMVAAIAMVIIIVAFLLGHAVSGKFSDVSSSIANGS
jgi:Flp pilus assembly pilin Flp